MKKIIAIVGMCGSGKSVVCEWLELRNYQKVYFGGVTMDKLKELNLEINPENEKMVREDLRKEYGMAAYAILSLPKIEMLIKENNVVIDGLYSWDELKVLKEKFPTLVVLAIINNKNIRYSRLTNREVRPLTKEEAMKRDIAEIENLAKGGPIAYADYFILNNNNLDDYQEQFNKVVGEIESETI